VLPIRIPPLRERPADIEPLARHFLRTFAGPAAEIDAAALARLRQHDWPGNVRELENAIHRAVILAGGEPVESRHLLLEPAPRQRPEAEPVSLDDAEREAIQRVLVKTRGNRAEAAAALGISPRTLRHKLQRYRDGGRPVPEGAR
jgi:two-component system response regulator FlrC